MDDSGARDLITQIGGRIKEMRASKQMSQAELSDLCGLQKASLSRIESGKTNITMRTLICIVNALNITMADFLGSLD
ncbi:MAG: helix-turn-helix transcriptional regulator [Chitinophagaceae bacterium]